MGMMFIGIVVTVISLIAYVTYRRLQQEKAETAKLMSLNNTVKQTQERYKNVVGELASASLVNTDTRRKLITVVNNYFVFQPVNAINLAHLTDLADVFVHAIEGHYAEPKVSDERLTEILTALASAIPESTRDFSSNYYLNYAPGLFFEFANQVKDDIHEPVPEEESTVELEALSEDGSEESVNDNEPEEQATPKAE